MHHRNRQGGTLDECLSIRLRRQVALLRRRLDRAAAALMAAATPAAIHGTRVAARRLRVLLQAYSRELDSEARKRCRRELEELTSDLEPAREADVARRIILRLARNRDGHIDGDSRALFVRAVRRYESEVKALRAITAGAHWRQRLTDLRRLFALSTLVRENESPAVSEMRRLVKRRRRRLRRVLASAGKNPARLHRIRLKIKAMRYLLEGRPSKSAMAENAELNLLRQLQNCLGDMHDEENVLETLRAERKDRAAARKVCRKLELQKGRQLHVFKKHCKALTQLWDGR
jgi:CHAD domain-containing protein